MLSSNPPFPPITITFSPFLAPLQNDLEKETAESVCVYIKIPYSQKFGGLVPNVRFRNVGEIYHGDTVRYHQHLRAEEI